jgi:hypothetical protein
LQPREAGSAFGRNAGTTSSGGIEEPSGETATGRRTPAGNAKTAQNGRWNQAREESVREAHRTASELSGFINQMEDLRAFIARLV